MIEKNPEDIGLPTPKDYESGVVADDWRTSSFECPDCFTQIHIVTNLPERFKPFRISCPCAFAKMHRYRECENVPYDQIDWEALKKRWEEKDGKEDTYIPR